MSVPTDPKDVQQVDAAMIQPGDRMNCNACGGSRKWGHMCGECGHWTDTELLYHLGDRLHRTIEAYDEIEQLHAARGERVEGWACPVIDQHGIRHFDFYTIESPHLHRATLIIHAEPEEGER